MKKHLPLIAAALLLAPSSPAATQTDIPGPPGSGAFGTTVTVLPNGNFVVTDPSFDQLSPLVENIGAVYLYNPDGLLLSTLLGRTASDQIGSGGINVLANGNFVVLSPQWDSITPSATQAGAVTWGSATTGFIGGPTVTVSPANSLVGSTSNDRVGTNSVTGLTNGNFVVITQFWDSGLATNVGAITWGNGLTGITGPVSPENSLVGSTASDQVGINGVTALTNGHYVVGSQLWNNGSVPDAGAATWGNGFTGITGPITPANSLVGTTSYDYVSFRGITALTNGNYIVNSEYWNDGLVQNTGAVTWGDGSTGSYGPITSFNSFVGSAANDFVGSGGVTALVNGNYIVLSHQWANSGVPNAGAVTWGNGFSGSSGPVNSSNSLVGTTADDRIGFYGVTALTNGNYVVNSSDWDNGSVPDVGASTWGNGVTGTSGPVSQSNSLVGSTTGDMVGFHAAVALTNGNYVVPSSYWDNGLVADVGAATWCNGLTGTSGPVSLANSLVGSTPQDYVGAGITPLTNGNYVVSNMFWNKDSISQAGAATWGNGFTGTTGTVSAINSLIGSSFQDYVGGSITALTNGHYVVGIPNYSNNPGSSVGAVTWANGYLGRTGPVTPSNSLIAPQGSNLIGINVTPLANGNYVITNLFSSNGQVETASAATWVDGSTQAAGSILSGNSLVGSLAGDSDGDLGSSTITPLPNGHYVVHSPNWNNGLVVRAGAVTLGNGYTGTAGLVSRPYSVLGDRALGGANLVFGYDRSRNQLIVGKKDSNSITLIRRDVLRTLASSSPSAPPSNFIRFSKLGTAAVNSEGSTLIDFTLPATRANQSSARALFAFTQSSGTAFVLQTGIPLSSLGNGLPSNAAATTLISQLYNRSNLGLFQATVKGTGITTANNRLLLLDNGVSVQILHRTGTPIPALANAPISTLTEVLQSHDQNLISLAYKLKSGTGITSANDTGLLFLNHSGTVSTNVAAREGQPAFGGAGNFGSFTGRTAAGLGNTIHFTALYKPTAASPVPAVFSTTLDGITTARLAKSGDSAPNSGSATYSSFPAITQQSGSALVRATLKASPTSQNEGLYSLPANTLLTRKGDPIGGGLNIARIVRFWPAGPNQIILHVQLTGVGVTTSNNQALILRQSDSTYLTLLRTGTPAPAPAPAPARLATISAIDVNPVSGLYAILGTLSGAPSSSNQALWTGDPTLGDDNSLQVLRLPQLTLRKGNPYSTSATPSGIIRSIALKPAIDPTGAGGRGLAQALGANGDLALFITTDRNLTELVLLDR